jgi:hypothetical protein
VRPQLADGRIDPDRYARWRKLAAQDAALSTRGKRRGRT